MKKEEGRMQNGEAAVDAEQQALACATPLRGSKPAGRYSAPWKRFLRYRPAQLSTVLLLFLIVTSIVSLPFSVCWHDVQELGSAVRHEPSLSPIVPYENFAKISSPSAADRPRGLKPAARLGARIAYRATSWFGHDDLGRSLLYRVLPGFLVSLAIGLAAAMMAMVES